MKIFIIILHYGTVETTQKCVASILEKEKNFEKIIIINNDEMIQLTKKTFGKTLKLHIINNRKNLGFAAGVNEGIRFALEHNADAVLLLNNDTILNKEILYPLVVVLQKEKYAGIAGPVLQFHRNGKIIYDLGGRVNSLFGRTSHEEVETIFNKKSKEVTYISGCCMLIKKEVFATIGYFDEKFFLYYEDVDFCLRAKKGGFLSYILPSVSLYHELSKSAGKLSSVAVYHQTKSGIVFGKKYCKTKIFNFAFLFMQSMLFLVKRPSTGIYAFKGFRDGLLLNVFEK